MLLYFIFCESFDTEIGSLLSLCYNNNYNVRKMDINSTEFIIHVSLILTHFRSKFYFRGKPDQM